MLSEYKTTLPLKTVDNAEPEAKAVLEAAQKKMGFVPNMYTNKRASIIFTVYLTFALIRQYDT